MHAGPEGSHYISGNQEIYISEYNVSNIIMSYDNLSLLWTFQLWKTGYKNYFFQFESLKYWKL